MGFLYFLMKGYGEEMKEVILGILGVIGSVIVSMFGGWDAGLVTLYCI